MLEIFNNLNIPTEIQSIVLDRKEIINLPLVKFELPSIDKKVKKKKKKKKRTAESDPRREKENARNWMLEREEEKEEGAGPI